MINLNPVNSVINASYQDNSLATYFVNIQGTDGADQVYGTPNDDLMHGNKGDDVLGGGGGNDIIYGDEGSDTIDGGVGNDELHGGIGDDTFIGGPGADKFFGDAGFDTVTYASATKAVTVDLVNGGGGVNTDSQGDTYSSIEAIVGTAYADSISGDMYANTLSGGAGDDIIYGRGGDDEIHGATGNDTIKGGAGNDYLSGGPGSDTLTGDDAGQVYSDTFVLSPNTGPDTITDFQAGVDKIELYGCGAQPLGADGSLAVGSYGPWWYGGGIDASDKVVYNATSHELWQVQVDWDSSEDAYYVTEMKEIATFSNGVVPHSGDFVV